MDRVLDALTAAGMTVRPAHGGASSTCPLAGHKRGDRNPSLSIQYVAKDARTRIRCHLPAHKGQEEAILATVGLGIPDLYDEPKPPSDRASLRGAGLPKSASRRAPASEASKGPRPSAQPQPVEDQRQQLGRIVARYDYVDRDGRPVLRVLRYDPKDFRQQKRSGSRWVAGAPPAEERVLYRLPEVLSAGQAGGVVHLCEGEKDADAVASAAPQGVAATTVPMGAAKWLPQYTKQLVGASLVVIWRDKDDAGDQHARTVAAALDGAQIPWLVVEAAQGKDPADHLAAGHGLDEVVPVTLELEPAAEEGPATAGGEDVEPAEGVAEPGHPIPMGRGTWAFELGGDGRRRRGVWTHTAEQGWRWVAPLPHVHARIVQRDGTGRRTATAYLVSAEEDGTRQVVTHDQMRTAAWANALGLALSADDRITRAATTAIIYAAERAEEREETPRVVGGKVTVPTAETLPAGYLQTSSCSTEEARAGWAALIGLVAKSPKMALVVGASAIAPFVAASRRQSHFLYLYGDAAQGKTVALNTAGAIWGLASQSPEDDGAHVVTPWNASAQGPFRFLGELGVLPPLWDEIGQASYQGAREWGKFIFDVCEGARRITPGQRGAQTAYGRPWRGIFIAAGNGRLLDGLGAGRYAGIARRVIELPTPLTVDREHAEAIADQWQTVYGHAGLALLHEHTAETVRPHLDAAAGALGAPDSAIGLNVAKHLHAHVAGAALLDAWAGTGTTLRDAATAAAAEYLQGWAEPEHDADRMLEAVQDAMGREPARWPTVAAYSTMRRPVGESGGADTGGADLPRHGVDRSVTGLRDDDGAWVAVFAHTWRETCADLGLDSAVCARELHTRGILRVSEGRRRRGEWTTQVRAAGGAGLYQLVLPTVDQPDQPDLAHPPAPTPEPDPLPMWPPAPAPAPPETAATAPDGPVGGRAGGVGGDVGGADKPLTCDVGGVGGVGGEKLPSHARANPTTTATTRSGVTALHSDQPCVICRTPARHAVGGDPIHTGQCLLTWQEDHPGSPAAPVPGGPAGHLPGSPVVAPPAAPTTPPADAGPPARPGREGRFTAPAAVVDGTSAHLPGGQVVDVPGPSHLGDLAALVHPQALALGHGGDNERRPDLGQVWLTAASLELLGLPTELPADDQPRATALAALAGHPAVVGALEQGWQLGQGGRMREWTRIWHPDRLPQGAWLVAGPWQRLDGVALFDDDPHPAELADRLAAFAAAVGISYRLSPATTGLDLIDHTRPPIRPGRDPHPSRVAVVRGEPAELPGWLRRVDDARARNVEQDWSWWRLWTSLTDQERSRRYVHLYDRNKAYFSSWSGVELGVSGLVHLEGDDAAWDGSEKPGYYRIDRPAWGHTALPDPGRHLGFPLADGTAWCTVHTLRMLKAHDIDPQVHEAYTWAHTSRYLELAAKQLRPLLTNADPGPVPATVKNLYTNVVGKLAEIDHDPSYHLWRPDWRHHVIGLNKAMILRTLTQTGQRTGIWPLLVVGRDTIAYASDQPDPVAAWPGQPGHLGGAPGQWKPAGRGDLQGWGPKHLVKLPGRWRMSALHDLALSGCMS